MKINQTVLGILVVVLVFGTVLIASAMGLWQTEGNKVPVRYQIEDFEGQYNPADIRGSYYFADISELFEVPLEDLGKAFNIEDENAYGIFQCKNLEAIYSDTKIGGKVIGTNSVRVFVALYKGLPIDLDNGTYFPNTAQQILINAGNLTEEQEEFVAEHLVDSVHVSNQNLANLYIEESENKIKGKTTFQEVLSLGVSKEDIEKVINGDMPNKSTVIRDYCQANGIPFSTVKSALQELVDK